MRRFRLRAAVSVALVASGCSRPLTGRDLGSTILQDLQVKPEYVRADTPIDLSFKVTGVPPETVSYDISGNTGMCSPTRESDTRFHCMHPGVTRQDFMQGPTLIVVETRDKNGKSSVVTHPLTIDFECPRFLGLRVSPEAAQPGDTAVVTIEASEALGEPPVVTHAGHPWETAVGTGQMWTVTHAVTDADPQTDSGLVVRISDLAGNSSGDCGQDGQLKFFVDHTPPTIDIVKVSISRGAPGTPSTIKAAPMAFIDDVGVKEVQVLDASGMITLATLKPLDDGSLPETSLGLQPKTRVILKAVDGFGRTSPALSVPERWRLSIGSGATPNAAIRVASRFTPAEPGSTSMRNRTVALAPDVFEADARAATVRTQIGFEKVGMLSSRYEDVHHIISGYEPVGKRILAAGGCRGTDCNFYSAYVDDVTLIQWDETEGEYVSEQGPTLVLAPQTSTIAPNPRFGWSLAADGTGCATMFGGDSLYLDSSGYTNSTIVGDVWQLCYAPPGYKWKHIPIGDTVDGSNVDREAPIIFDPKNSRYVTIGAAGIDNPKALFLLPNADPAQWQWVLVSPLPTSFVDRFEHLLYYDTKVQGVVTGLGFPQGSGNGEQSQYWTYADGQWTLTSIPNELWFRAYFGWAYDTSRHQLVLWGGVGQSAGAMDPPEPEVWLLTGSSTSGPSAWRKSNLDHPVPRLFPSLVWDPDREVIVVFGGVRTNDTRVVPAEIHQIVIQPSRPFLQATVDLAADRPKGIATLHLQIRASGSADADGLGPGVAAGNGVLVQLWDFMQNAWIDMKTTTGSAGGIEDITIDVTTNPEVYVGPNGTVPISITTRHQATEAVSGRLDVDLIDGYLDLRPGVPLP
jgi:hypothetical protein